MARKSRIEYLVTTLCVFLSSFLLYGFVGSIEPLVNDSKLYSFLLLGFFGGFCFSMVVSTIILIVKFFSKRNLAFKIVAAVLWPITFVCAFYAGFFCCIPYQIYNLVKIIKDKPQSNTDEKA